MKRIYLFILLLSFFGNKFTSYGETLEDAQKRIEERQEIILRTLDRLTFQKGLLFKGRIKLWTDVDHLQGPAINTNFATWKNESYLQADLTMEAQPADFIYGGWTMRFKSDIGNMWGGMSLSTRDLFFRVDLFDFIRLNLGNYRKALTPFTVYAQDREYPFDPAVFNILREEQRYDLYLDKPNHWLLQGADLSAGFYVDHLIDELHLNAFTAILGENPLRLLTGARINILRQDKILNIGANWTRFDDIRDSVPPALRPMLGSQAISVDWKINPVRIFGLFGELGLSTLNYYTNSKSGTLPMETYEDTALQAGLYAGLAGTEFKIMYLSVGNEYFAPGAQTPVWDTDDNSKIVDVQKLSAGFHERIYNSQIKSARTFDHGLFLGEPVGIATPNREGFRIEFSSDSLSFLSVKMAGYDLLSIRPVSTSNVRHYRGAEAGIKIDVRKIIFIRNLPVLSGFYSYENQTRPDDKSITLDESEDLFVTVWGAGFEMEIFNKLSILAGYNFKLKKGHFWLNINTDANPLSENIVNSFKKVNLEENVIACALKYNFTKEMSLFLEYYYREYNDKITKEKNYEVDTLRLYATARF